MDPILSVDRALASLPWKDCRLLWHHVESGLCLVQTLTKYVTYVLCGDTFEWGSYWDTLQEAKEDYRDRRVKR